MAVNIGERLAGIDETEMFRRLLDSFANSLRVAIPAVVQSFDPVAQTVVLQPLIKERIQNPDLTQSWVQLPLLLDVPVVFPRAGGFAMTMPITAGDEGIALFQDMCFDQWWVAGGVQIQAEKRRHDLSDAVFLPGVWNQTRTLPNFSTTAAQLRNDAGTSYISINNDGSITIKGKTQTVTY